nr:threonylcarbamoyl-AMP synthase [Bacteroidota bacterium]
MEKDIEKAIKVLKEGGTILYPTDTIWGIGCDATNQKAVDKIYRIKQRIEGKSLLILVANIDMINQYVAYINPLIYDLVSNYDRPLTVIYPGAKNVARGVSAPDQTVGIRVVDDHFCRTLIGQFGKAIVSTSANMSGDPSPVIFQQISESIKNSVDFIVNHSQDNIRSMKASRIIRVKDNGHFEIVRP